jgi:hypothetical protein
MWLFVINVKAVVKIMGLSSKTITLYLWKPTIATKKQKLTTPSISNEELNAVAKTYGLWDPTQIKERILWNNVKAIIQHLTAIRHKPAGSS